MEQNLQDIQERAIRAAERAKSPEDLREVSRIFLGRKGELTQVLRSIEALRPEDRKRAGSEANRVRDELRSRFTAREKELRDKAAREREESTWLDITAPGIPPEIGSLHPLTLIQRRAVGIFRSMGFSVARGPEIETEWYNFDALNLPLDHPARDMQDTFWLKGELDRPHPGKGKRSDRLLLRTHTSPVQVRYLESHEPPLRIVAPGRVFRHEATDARHEANLYQLEGLMIGRDVSVANMKFVIEEFLAAFFEAPMRSRLRPSFFPFTEPSFEVDMSCAMCGGAGCASCGRTGWIEMMGAGMVHPRVLEAAGRDPEAWQGFAFGMGLDRLAMMYCKVNDIRLFYGGDLAFLRQFSRML